VRRRQSADDVVEARGKDVRQHVCRVRFGIRPDLGLRRLQALLHLEHSLWREGDAVRRRVGDELVVDCRRFAELRLAREGARRVLDAIRFRRETKAHVLCGGSAGGEGFKVRAVLRVSEDVCDGLRRCGVVGVEEAERGPLQLCSELGRRHAGAAAAGVLGARVDARIDAPRLEDRGPARRAEEAPRLADEAAALRLVSRQAVEAIRFRQRHGDASRDPNQCCRGSAAARRR